MYNELDWYNRTTLMDIGEIDLKLQMDRYDLKSIWRILYPGSFRGRAGEIFP